MRWLCRIGLHNYGLLILSDEGVVQICRRCRKAHRPKTPSEVKR